MTTVRRLHPARILALLTILLVFTSLAPLRAAEPESGQALFSAGRFEEAYQALFKAFLVDPGNPEINFLLGRAAFETGRYEEAVMAYERVLIAQPDAERVKLELARAHLRLGSREIARQYFKEVLAANPPEPVARNIERFLVRIEESEKRHFINGTLSVGISRDDNVHLAPVSDLVSIGLFEFRLTGATAQPIDDQIYTNTLVINHLYRNDELPFSWKSSFTNYNAAYENQNTLDVNYFGFGSGPIFQAGGWLVDLQLLASYLDVEYDRYQSSFGAGASVTTTIAPDFTINLGAKVKEKNNYVDGGRDATNLLYTVSPVLAAGDNRLSLSLSKEYEIADNAVNGYNRLGWQARYDRKLPRDFDLYLSAGYTLTTYDAIHPLFGVHRDDKLRELSVGLSKLLWQDKKTNRLLAAQLAHTASRSQSNIDLYTYDKDVSTFTLTLNF